MSKTNIKVLKTNLSNNWTSYTYFEDSNFVNRINYSNGVFRCVEKLYCGGILCYHYSYIDNTDILDGEIIAYE